MYKAQYRLQYKSPNIVIEPTEILNCTETSIPKDNSYLNKCEISNINIELSGIICKPPSPKRIKHDCPPPNQSPEYVDTSFLDDFNIDEIVACLDNSDETHTYTETDNLNNKGTCKNLNNTFSLDTLNNLNNTDVDGDDKNNENTEINDTKSYINNDIIDNEGIEMLIETTISYDDLENENDTEIRNYTHSESIIDSKGMSTSKLTNTTIESIPLKEEGDTEIRNYQDPQNINQSNCTSTNKVESKPIQTVIKNDDLEYEKSNNEIRSYSHLKSINQSKSMSPKKIESVINTNLENDDYCYKDDYSYEDDDTKMSDHPHSRHRHINLCKKLEYEMLITLEKRFSILSVIHNGKFSKIFKCQNSDKKIYVVKMLYEEASFFRDGYCKNTMLSKLQENVTDLKNYSCVYLFDSFTFKNQWCFLMEYYPKTLREEIESGKPFHIDDIKNLGSQLVEAVTLLKNNNIIHAEINPSHILLNHSNTKLRLCGFDNAYYKKYKNPIVQFNEYYYRAPEIILGHSVGFSIDVWSTALVLYEMATGRPLFPGYTNRDMLYRMVQVLGNVPSVMLQTSLYAKKYFKGTGFIRLLGQNNMIIIHNFTATSVIRKSIYSAHIQSYGTMTEKDLKKINPFVKLLTEMLVIYPNNRVNINFVNKYAF